VIFYNQPASPDAAGLINLEKSNGQITNPKKGSQCINLLSFKEFAISIS
jgi:hypothetical protein